MRFVLADRNRRLAGVRLVEDLGLPGQLRFTRERTEWSLHIPRPPVDRLEYLFEVEDGNGHHSTIRDPGNDRRVAGAFGEKSVLEFPEYAPPTWLSASGVDGVREPFEIGAPRLDSAVTGEIWSPAGLAPDQPTPMLVVHDGPEYDALGRIVLSVAVSIAAGVLPPVRVALLGPGERNEWYAANDDYAATLADHVLPALPPASQRLGIGVSLGALAMLHAHRRHPASFAGLLLQSGSFFTPELDGQESDFAGFEAVAAFVASVHDGVGEAAPVPVAMTCGLPEENFANNERLRRSLTRLGYPVSFAGVRDGHNYTAWRDSLHPHLIDLVNTVVATHAA